MTILPWAGFVVLVLALMALDLGFFHRKAHAVGTREALGWTGFWMSLALCFNVLLYFMYEHHWLGIGVHIGQSLSGKDAALQFLTGYLIEQSLSVDNIFVFAVIFTYFNVPMKYQHRVLFWGILGVLIMRGIMIALGAALISRFEWVSYVFGGFLILTAAKMLVVKQDDIDPEHNPLVRLARRWFPVSTSYDGSRFVTRVDGHRVITPLMLVLLMVESTDVMFAVDSIPAIFAVTQDSFIVFTSNVFAILGLRSLYFAVAGMMSKFRYLKISLVFVLAFVGVKMILAPLGYHIPIPISLGVILGILAVGVVASLVASGRENTQLLARDADE